MKSITGDDVWDRIAPSSSPVPSSSKTFQGSSQMTV